MILAVWIALGLIAGLVLLFVFLPVAAWILVGLVALILILVLVIPIGADVAYIGGEFSLSARADGFAIRLFPRKPPDPDGPPKEDKPKKPKKEKKPKKPKSEKEDKPKKKFDFTLEEIFELIQKVFRGLGKFGKLTIRRFMLHYVAAGTDPYQTAMTYNYVNAALSTLAPICAQKFRVRGKVDVWTDIDFTADKMQLDAELSMTLRLIQLVHMALAVAFAALGILIKNRIRLRKERCLEEKSRDADPEKIIPIESITPETLQDEERKDSHG